MKIKKKVDFITFAFIFETKNKNNNKTSPNIFRPEHFTEIWTQ